MLTTTVITARLSGSDTCTAFGITATGHTPVFKLCRLLVEAGHYPKTPLHAYRGETLCLRVRSIGEGAGLKVTTGDSGSPIFAPETRAAAPPFAATSNRRHLQAQTHFGGDVMTSLKKFGHWELLSVANKRALCRCRCGSVHEVSLDALEDGSTSSCGCRPFTTQQKRNVFDQEKLRRATKIFTKWKPVR
jgi:hypothetical protein